MALGASAVIVAGAALYIVSQTPATPLTADQISMLIAAQTNRIPAINVAERLQATAMAYATYGVRVTAEPIPVNPARGAWAVYQLRTCGPVEYVVPYNGRTVRPDGIRAQDCTFLDAKYVGNPNFSYYIPGTTQSRPEATARVQARTRAQFATYAAIIADPTSPMTDLEIITNNKQADSYLKTLLVTGHTALIP